MNAVACSVALGVVLFGCGGGSPAASDDGGSGGAGGAPGLGIPGSLELRVDKVTVAPRSQGGPPAPPGVTSPSEGQVMRLDVRRGASGALEAVVTPRWGTPALVDGRATGGTYQLAGEVGVQGYSNVSVSVSDRWETLRLHAAGDGLGPTAVLRGTENVVEGDILWTFDIDATGTLRKDETPPEVRSAPLSVRGPMDALLPWDPIEVDLAEPIAPADLESHLAVVSTDLGDAGLSPLAVSWQYAPADDATSWAGVVRTYGRFDGWDHPPLQMLKPYELRAAAGIPDATGLLAKAFTARFTGLDVGAKIPGFTFDTPDERHPVSWGTVTFHDADAPCEMGGCVEVGPYNAPVCETGRHGVAGRVEAPTGTLEVRYRLRYAPDLDAPDQPPHPFGVAFVVDIAHAGGEVTSEKVGSPQSASLSDLGAAAGELRWAGPWTTVSVALPGPTPPSVIDLGFSVGSGEAVFGTCVGGPLPPRVKTMVVIDSISGR